MPVLIAALVGWAISLWLSRAAIRLVESKGGAASRLTDARIAVAQRTLFVGR